ncbi:serine O-acetyltransferase [Roseateles koreensis]|uniref:serine O-acetyltransferase n=1 Tax=Roseateles koreensis TaxID=2987526 RepID=A0ABT5KUM1_9BURK|nr:serine O-acetyltransferase [Roseateles koreensis]MDC8786053.1 serine O-acetyltransferase [Roseateles koreensis]
MDPTRILDNQLRAALYDSCDPVFTDCVLSTVDWQRLHTLLSSDLAAFSSKDPAAHGDPLLVLQSYTAFKAVLHYRLSHAILTAQYPIELSALRLGYAYQLANRGKMQSGIEIHPNASIGERFILDHGWGTVIGETAEIGDDCYILGGVTLGARGIFDNSDDKRHPTLGNRVQVGAFARLFGRIHIGDDTFIGPNCVIKDDIPSNSVVTIRSELQLVRQRKKDTPKTSNSLIHNH